MSGSGHTLLLETVSRTTSGEDYSGQMGCLQSNGSSCEGSTIPETLSDVTVHLHGGFSECLPVGDTSRSVEEIIKKLLIKYYPTIGPAAIHLFGLAILDTKKNDRFIWKSPRCMIKDLQGQTTNDANLKIFVRVRFIPAKDRLSKLKIFGSDVIRYLYHQLREDLISERMKNIYGSRNQLTSAKCRGLAVLNILINSRIEKKTVEYILEQHKLKDFLPPSECVAFLKRMKLEKNMKDHLRKFDQSHPEMSTDIEELMSGYVRDILKEMLDYSVEQYDANVLDMGKRIPRKVLVDIHHQPSGVFIDGIPFSKIEELCSASITPNYLNNSNTWNVHLDRTNGRPEVLEFASTEIAESFVSCLDGYYRLIHDFYFSLCSQMEPISLQSLKRIKSHGPIETSCAIGKLNSKMDDQECYYLCKQDVKNFDQFVLAYPSKGQIMTEIVQQESGVFYLLRDKEKSFPDPGRLVPYLMQTEHNNILSNNMIRLKPNVEVCGVLKRLFMEEVEAIPEEDIQHKEDSVLSRQFQPIIIPESHLEMKKLIGIGKFTQVHEGTYKDNKAVAVKFLRMGTSPQQLYNCLEPFLYALRQQMKFREVEEPAFFAGILGVCMTMPIKIVMDYAKEGSLSHFFANRQTDQPIYLRHLVYAATQVAQGLFQLEERKLHHGNICCQNILVYRYDMSEILVKIGDPGMIQVYESPLMVNNEKVNKKRLPWIAPELLDKDKQHRANMKSDIFAFGTTVWEMFALGENPIDKPPLSSVSFEEQKNLCRSDKSKLPPTEGLKLFDTDSIHIKKCKKAMLELIMRCRVFCPDDRPTAKELVRDLNTLTASYANEYHDYDKIPDDDYPLWSDAETSGISPDADSDEEVPDILHSFPTPHVPSIPDEQSRRLVIERPMPSVPDLELTNPRPPIPTQAPSQHGRPPSRPLPQPITDHSTRPLPQPITDHPTWIRSNRLEISREIIGEGHYGKVMKGYLKSLNERILIAAKCLKGNDYTSVLQSREFTHESVMMEKLKHFNIVRFHGICDNMIIMEYVDNGAMSVFLRERRKSNNYMTADKLMAIMLDIAKGMKYMSDKAIIHSDLAGRNILMTKDLHAKISDFGLARHLSDGKDYYRRSKEKELPASWCSPEGLSTLKFTTLGDVWSYGVVLWEAYTHGRRPKYGEDFKNIVQRLHDGERLERPDGGQRCPDRVWDLMKWCWKYIPHERPSFQAIQEECSELLEALRSQTGVEETQANPSLLEPVTRGRTVSPPNIGITSPEPKKSTPTSPDVIRPTFPEPARHSPSDRVTPLGTSSPVSPISQPFNRELPRKPKDDLHFLISQSELQVMKDVVLGQGEFGCVYKGRYKQKDVAVKVIEEGCFQKRNHDLFWEEVDVFGRASHPNIVTFVGFIRDAHFLVMEFVPKGSLSAYLSLCSAGKETLSLRQNLGIMNDIASGMKYLVQMDIIHCDLAARNILLMDNMMAKISDFGLSKVLSKGKDYYCRGNKKRMPCWWSAPEVLLYLRLTHESDVWSYGIVAWEIFTQGETPNICEVGGKEIKDLIHIGLEHMRKGFRLKKEKTKNCPDDVFELMLKCWAWEGKDRPQFSFIHEQCLNFLSKYGETIQQ
ncbi:uncharacterized protein LOC110446410 [Mizuhopecten yessoensis]|uniref:Ephrin type-A receptor 4a n=1 Tax=Mizuhopecten yessoensis TaxID=6573 RepID=A0A210QXE9_MIZYE|nr:uncharacterized protein LOC110446410 [Mizuhopecten yessoensis]XP_021347223.1 uncharacterized protein LOC110446410 [Mizuhopecten yessoensis]OWF53418.1 Ephrin type-A receptor 4a [Mizuhopecten yessoensis]